VTFETLSFLFYKTKYQAAVKFNFALYSLNSFIKEENKSLTDKILSVFQTLLPAKAYPFLKFPFSADVNEAIIQ
jgi:hypothetical protein